MILKTIAQLLIIAASVKCALEGNMQMAVEWMQLAVLIAILVEK